VREEDNDQLNGSRFTDTFAVTDGGECCFIWLVNIGRHHEGFIEKTSRKRKYEKTALQTRRKLILDVLMMNERRQRNQSKEYVLCRCDLDISNFFSSPDRIERWFNNPQCSKMKGYEV
jgi:hypothetical protein